MKLAMIKHPRVTEKATILAEQHAYTFEVTKDATKAGVAHEIKTRYNVTPVKVNITTRPPKRVFIKGKQGMTPGVKKAVVYLKKGDSIQLA